MGTYFTKLRLNNVEVNNHDVILLYELVILNFSIAVIRFKGERKFWLPKNLATKVPLMIYKTPRNSTIKRMHDYLKSQ